MAARLPALPLPAADSSAAWGVCAQPRKQLCTPPLHHTQKWALMLHPVPWCGSGKAVLVPAPGRALSLTGACLPAPRSCGVSACLL